MASTPYFTVFLLLLLSIFGLVLSECSMYGVCHTIPAYFNYCPSTNETRIPQSLPPESALLQSQLMLKCPYLFADGNRDLCCDSRQVEALFKMISVANSLFSRCPSCMDNFYKYWCMYTCSPKQSDFLKVLETEPSPTTNKSMVVKVQYDLCRQYAESTYESCKDVKLSSSSGTAMLIMCGRLSANETCTMERWLNFMGTRSHGLGIPVDIVHKFHDMNSNSTFMHMDTTRCDQAARSGLSKCLPLDCPNSPVKETFILEDYGIQETCRLFGLGCSLYFLIFSVCVLLSVLSWALFPYFCRKQQDDSQSNSSIETQAHWIPKQIELNTELFGEFVSRQPFLVLISGFLFAFICCTGLFFLTVTSNPIEVWVPPNSRAVEEKEFFDTHFGPFYRVQQIIFYPKQGKVSPVSDGVGPVFQKGFLKEVFNVLDNVRNLSVPVTDGRRVTLDDICLRPMGNGYDCLINSPTNYFANNISLLDETVEEREETASEDDPFAYDEDESVTIHRSYLDHLGDCFRNPYTMKTSLNMGCLASWGGPTYPYLVFGGDHPEDPLNSTAVIVSIPLNSRADIVKMRAWEKSFIKYMKNYKHDSVQLSFMAERSIEDEIKRSSEADAVTFLIAVLLMILYSMFALGRYSVEDNRLSSLLVKSKIFVGFFGMISILAAILSALGILSFYGLRVPSAAIVVSSFVVLVIGFNRIFSVVRRQQGILFFSGSELGSSLPSALVCTVVQSVIFCIGAFIPVPAIRCFCLLSSLSIVLQFVFLSVLFLPICVLDRKREEKGTPEFVCCFQLANECEEFKEMTPRENKNLRKLFTLLLRPKSSLSIIAMSLLILVISPAAISRIKLGLDQKLAVPVDSYMYTHFKNMEKFLNVGPPVYFVVHGDIDFSDKRLQNKYCSLGGCEDNSVGGILSQATANPTKSYISGDVLNWLDNYIEWLAPENQCCTEVAETGAYCTERDERIKCSSCDTFNADSRPSKSVFYRHLQHFTEDVPGSHCVKGGRAAFHDALHFDPNGHVDASHLMTFHVPLRNSSAYISAMNNARLIAKKIEENLGDGARVFPYSVFYIFYEQFTTIRMVSAYQLIFAFSVVFLAVFLLIGFDVLQAFILLAVCCFQLILQASFMALWDVELNSISAVNLVLAVAICIEYSLPLLISFNSSTSISDSLSRTTEAAVTVASSTFGGLTVTMILGTSLLVFAQSPFFNVYFFRMLIVTALSGAFVGLFLLPALLSLCDSLKSKYRKSYHFEPVATGSSALSEFQSDGNSLPAKEASFTSTPLLSTVL